MGCGEKQLACNLPVLPEFVSYRLDLCKACEFNHRGICTETKKLHPNKEAMIDAGVLLQDAWCPEGKWNAVSKRLVVPGQRPNCPWCNRFYDGKTAICKWCYGKKQMEKRNASKGLNRRSSFQPFDTRSHEIKPAPFTGEVARDLHFFWYPRYAGSTEYHLDQLRKSIHLFNGKKVCCVAIDDNTVHEEYYPQIAELFDEVYVERNNPRRREGVGFIPTLKRLRSHDQNRVICFAHAKGQQHHTKESPIIREWSDAMYETVVRNWKNVEVAFEKGYPVAGSFKCIGNFRTTAFRWHYSGTFFWARSSMLFSNDRWQTTCTRWWQSESYVARHFHSDEGYCLFGDDIAGGSLYHESTWKHLRPKLIEWRKENAQVTTESLG